MGKNDLDMQETKAPPDRFVSCYITAKLIHAGMLVDMRKEWPHVYFTARWPLTANLSAEQSKPTRLWTRDNVDDIIRSEVVLGYADKDDDLTTVNWELAIAWAHGKEVYLVGPRDKFGDYAFADRVHRFEGMDAALRAISERARYRPSHVERLEERLIAIEAALPAPAKFDEMVYNVTMSSDGLKSLGEMLKENGAAMRDWIVKQSRDGVIKAGRKKPKPKRKKR